MTRQRPPARCRRRSRESGMPSSIAATAAPMPASYYSLNYFAQQEGKGNRTSRDVRLSYFRRSGADPPQRGGLVMGAILSPDLTGTSLCSPTGGNGDQEIGEQDQRRGEYRIVLRPRFIALGHDVQQRPDAEREDSTRHPPLALSCQVGDHCAVDRCEGRCKQGCAIQRAAPTIVTCSHYVGSAGLKGTG